MTARTYGSVHEALRRERGSAVGKPCAAPGCGRPANGWGLTTRPTSFSAKAGAALGYSTDLDAYAPLCASHNAQRDHGGDWHSCPRGHVRLVWGTTNGGHCRGCRREWSREYNARQKSRRLAGSTPTPGTITEQNGGQS